MFHSIVNRHRPAPKAAPAQSNAVTHLPFFRALAERSEEDASWCAIACGLAAMRLLDCWANRRDSLPEVGVRALRRSIRTIEQSEMEAAALPALRDLASAMIADVDRCNPAVLRCTSRYADVLLDEAHWSLAADVLRTILNVANDEDRFLLPGVARRLGRCQRYLGQFDDAARTYLDGGRWAAAIGDAETGLNLRIAEANMLSEQGKFVEAELALHHIAADARALSLPTIQAKAVHDRATVAHRRGEISKAIPLYFTALELYPEHRSQQRVIHDIGLTLSQLDQYELARDAFLEVKRDSSDQELRWSATVNLLEVAVATRNKMDFQTHLVELATVELPVRLALYYNLTTGAGWLRFGQGDHARTALDRARRIVDQFGVDEAAEDVDQLRRAVDAGPGLDADVILRFWRRQKIDHSWSELSAREDIRAMLNSFRDRQRSHDAPTERPLRRATP